MEMKLEHQGFFALNQLEQWNFFVLDYFRNDSTAYSIEHTNNLY